MSKLSRRRSMGGAATGEWLELVPRLEDETYHLAPRRNGPQFDEVAALGAFAAEGAADDWEAELD
jgi:hypothetical protein